MHAIKVFLHRRQLRGAPLARPFGSLADLPDEAVAETAEQHGSFAS
jgi:hypothetical protein